MEIPLAELISAMATRQPDLSEFLNKNLFIRTVTYHYTGRVVDVSSAFLKLERAAWIANSGRWANALETGELDEVEPYPDEVYIAVSSIVDISIWTHPLPDKQK